MRPGSGGDWIESAHGKIDFCGYNFCFFNNENSLLNITQRCGIKRKITLAPAVYAQC